MINYIKVIVQYLYVHNAWEISGFFKSNLKDFTCTESFFVWIGIRNVFFYILDPDPYKKIWYGSATLVLWYTGTLKDVQFRPKVAKLLLG